jgi:hypothetical protein
MDPRPPNLTSQARPVSAAGGQPRRGGGRPRGTGGGRVKVGPWRARRRFLPLALVPVLVYLALWLLVGYSLGAAGCRGPRQAVPLLGARPAAGGAGTSGTSGTSGTPETSGISAGTAVAAGPAASSSFAASSSSYAAASSSYAAAASSAAEVLVESDSFAPPPSTAGNRFDTGWQARRLGGREALLPLSGSGRLLAVNLGEEEPRTLTLDLAREGLPEGGRLSVRTGDRELARATLRADALPLRVRLPEDLPVGQVPLDLVFEPAGGAAPGGAAPGRGPALATTPAAVRGRGEGGGTGGIGGTAGAGGPAARPGAPAFYGARLAPALPAGSARVDGADVVMAGNCLVYLRCRLAGQEALVGTFVPPADARPGQRFELSVERPDGTPIRRFGWRPSFWNRLRGARTFELPLRGATGPVRVRLISRAGDAGSGGGQPGRWRALGLSNVTGEILTPGQGQ